MTDEYGIGTPVDEDYIDVEKRRADVSTTDRAEDDDDLRRDRRGAHHVLDDRGGNGAATAIEDTIDEGAIIEHDGRASTRTFFRPSEADSDKRGKFGRLIQWQEDKWSGMKNEQRKADRQRKIAGFCGHLGMSGYQQSRVEAVSDDLNFAHMGPYSSEKVILAVISIVANEDDRFIRDEDSFRELLVSVDLSLKRLKSVRSLVRDKSEVL